MTRYRMGQSHCHFEKNVTCCGKWEACLDKYFAELALNSWTQVAFLFQPPNQLELLLYFSSFDLWQYFKNANSEKAILLCDLCILNSAGHLLRLGVLCESTQCVQMWALTACNYAPHPAGWSMQENNWQALTVQTPNQSKCCRFEGANKSHQKRFLQLQLIHRHPSVAYSKETNIHHNPHCITEEKESKELAETLFFVPTVTFCPWIFF